MKKNQTQSRREGSGQNLASQAIPAAPSEPPFTVLAAFHFLDAWRSASQAEYGDALSQLEGLRDTILHHPGFAEHVRALDLLIEGDKALQSLVQEASDFAERDH